MQCKKALVTILVLSSLSACSAYKKFSPVSTTFLEDVDTTKRVENLPFSHSWAWNRDFNKQHYSQVYIAPVRTDTLPADAHLASISTFLPTAAAFQEKAAEVAEYFRGELIKELEASPEKPFKIVDQPNGPGTAVVTIAFTELEFSHPVANAGTLLSPVPGTGAALSMVVQPHAAFAMRITDGTNGALLATIADRKFPPIRVVDVNQYTVSSSVREICGDWAKEIADTFLHGRFAEVESRGIFRLLPW